MLYEYLKRGAVAGAVGGVAYGLYIALVGNPLVEYAEKLAHDHAHDQAHGAGSEAVMHAISVGSGVALGMLFGVVVFGLAAYLFEPALPEAGGSYLLGAAGFLTVSGVPWLVLPPAAPGVDTGMSTEAGLYLYAGLVVVGAVACLGAGAVYHRLRSADSGRGLAVLAGASVFAVVVGLAVLVAPSPTYESTLPADFEAAYSGAIVIGQLGLWGITAATRDRIGAVPMPERPVATPQAGD